MGDHEDPRLARIPTVHDYRDFLIVEEFGLRFPVPEASARRAARKADVAVAREEWMRTQDGLSKSKAREFHMAEVAIGGHLEDVGDLTLRAFPAAVVELRDREDPVGQGATEFLKWWNSQQGQAVIEIVFRSG